MSLPHSIQMYVMHADADTNRHNEKLQFTELVAAMWIFWVQNISDNVAIAFHLLLNLVDDFHFQQ